MEDTLDWQLGEIGCISDSPGESPPSPSFPTGKM